VCGASDSNCKYFFTVELTNKKIQHDAMLSLNDEQREYRETLTGHVRVVTDTITKGEPALNEPALKEIRTSVPLGHRLLHRDRAAHRIDGRWQIPPACRRRWS
jgi:hypothetical protein